MFTTKQVMAEPLGTHIPQQSFPDISCHFALLRFPATLCANQTLEFIST